MIFGMKNLATNDPVWEVTCFQERVAKLEHVACCLKGRPNPKQQSTGGSGPRDQTFNLGSPRGALESPTYACPHLLSVSSVPWSPTPTEIQLCLILHRGSVVQNQ
ncbi:uncharacterized protein MELLADRAFT_103740 [Melampsora larici-populina 98AG31]|uniref:Uncharacterized protein n=1 Tax=Melampsora larici-populina (strain 98AG31 / pathotype 3-4-7) TaxID=747676 RepID=F4RC80_MELLP|nr:uncharacterized protein MELLADRAFT_103740 [Melampsora larici-populina 98AG31]EGG09692.1 hypothetical protein MELLADRAFT_103740 [Melampsora larici-populina 98AG31]